MGGRTSVLVFMAGFCFGAGFVESAVQATSVTAEAPIPDAAGFESVSQASQNEDVVLLLMEREVRDLQLLARENASHPSGDVVLSPDRQEQIAYSSDSLEQTVNLHLPGGGSSGQPIVFLPQGRYFPDLVAFLAEKGYPIVSVSLRGDTFRNELEDSFCALAWFHANAARYGLEPARIVQVGGSMTGGNAALLAAMDDPGPFLEGCPYSLPDSRGIAGVIALAGVFDLSLEDDFFEGFIGNITDFMEGTPQENPDNWTMASAINHIDGGEPPFLLLHGTADVNVKENQSRVFAEALEKAGVDVELILLPGLGHREIVASETAFELMVEFLGGCL